MSTTCTRRTKIEKIEHLSSRQVTFSKRRKGLFTKAEDFSRLCGAEIAVIVFSNTNKLYEFSCPSMDHILSRYMKEHEHTGGSGMEITSHHEAPSSSSSDSSSATAALLQDEIRALNLDCSRLKGTELDGMSLRELDELEKQIREGIEPIEKRKIDMEKENYYYQPVHMIEDSDCFDGKSRNFFYGSSSSAVVSDCTESELSNNQFVDTCLRL